MMYLWLPLWWTHPQSVAVQSLLLWEWAFLGCDIKGLVILVYLQLLLDKNTRQLPFDVTWPVGYTQWDNLRDALGSLAKICERQESSVSSICRLTVWARKCAQFNIAVRCILQNLLALFTNKRLWWRTLEGYTSFKLYAEGVENCHESSLRCEWDKKPLVKNHGGIATSQAYLTVRCFAIYNLCWGHIARCERSCWVKPNPRAHPYEESSGYEIVFEIAAISIIVGWFWWRSSRRPRGLWCSYMHVKLLLLLPGQRHCHDHYYYCWYWYYCYHDYL